MQQEGAQAAKVDLGVDLGIFSRTYDFGMV
jgi:hypothetical protein